MKLFKRSKDLLAYTASQKHSKIGLTPTMGALHDGHASLFQQSNRECDITIVSIFVNPTQFNEASDLAKYPVTTSADIELLVKNDVDILYFPTVAEIYPNGVKENFEIDLDYLDNILEGEFRPGHFKGVAQVVHGLVVRTSPDRLYMGQKDYQQLAVVRSMLSAYNLDTELVSCPIIRETDGLAKSSRNVRLTSENRRKSQIISQTLTFAKENLNNFSIPELERICMDRLRIEDFNPEYFKIKNSFLLDPSTNPDDKARIALTACWAGEVRLIDNMFLN